MRRALLIIAGGYLALVGLMFLTQHSLLYLPNLPGRALTATPEAIGLSYEDVTLTTEDGVALHGWWLPGETETTLLFFHGNAGNISHRLQSLRQFRSLGLSVLIIDYRGYGQSDGRPGEQGTYQDARAAWRHVTEQRGVAPRDVVVFGRSLGGAIAAWLAAEKSPGALIVEGAFTSIPDLGQELYWYLPVRWLSRFDYPTREFVARTDSPVLIVHSRDDELARFHHGEALYEAARGTRQLLALRGSHNEASVLDEARYLGGIGDFLAAQGLAVMDPASSSFRGWIPASRHVQAEHTQAGEGQHGSGG
jgi:uncharacterized protein